MKTNFALGIEVNLNAPTGREPFCEERAKRLQRKARPAGKRPKTLKMAENGQEVNKTRWLFDKDNMLIGHFADIQFYFFLTLRRSIM
jgi:hypothetical protein